MVTTTLVKAGLPARGRMVSISTSSPTTAPAAMATSRPAHPGAPFTTEIW